MSVSLSALILIWYTGYISFPQPGDDIVFMAQTLEKVFLQKVSQMPKEECEVPAIMTKEQMKMNAGILMWSCRLLVSIQ